MEHKKCCGTTCDKQRVAAEFEKLKRERDEALAQNERLRAAGNDMWSWILGDDEDQPEELSCACDAWLDIEKEQPPAALATLKAEWQAKQYSDGMPAQKAFWEGFERGAINGAANIRAHWNEWNNIRQRAQEAAQPCTYPDCRCPIDLPHKDSPCAIGRKKDS